MEEMQPGKVLCLIGDSTMQAYQMPDGLSLGAQLETRARKDIDPELRVLALAVGGYGSLQEEMLYERYCRALAPRAVVWAWNENDPANNDYVAERYFNPSSNNMRRRPYLENGAIVIRKPYRLQLFGLEEQSILLRLVNASLLNLMPGAPPYGAQEAERRGFAVAESILTARAAELGNKFILLAGSEARGITDFSKSSGITTVVVPPFSAEEVCMPRDSHPNELGHRKMLEVLWPVLKSRL